MTVEEMVAELEAIVRQQTDPEGVYTTEELSDMMDIPVNSVRKRLRALKKAGRLEATRKMAEGIDGAMYSVQAYRVMPA